MQTSRHNLHIPGTRPAEPPPSPTITTATIRRADLVETIAAALQYISTYHPADYIAHLARAYEREQGPAARDAIAQILTNSRMCAEGRRPICQDTGIVNVFLEVGMDLRWEGFGSGSIDALWTCGYPYVRFQSQLRLLAVPIYQGRPTYQSYLIRSAGDDSVRGWSDLRGKVFAYSDPLSNSGWLVAQGQLAQAQIASRELRRAFFAHGHRNVAEAVAARLANAGSIDGYVWETMKLQGMSAVSQTEVIWKSPSHGFPPIVAPLGAGHLQLDELQRALLEMNRDEPGRALLKALNLDGFVAGTPGLFDSIRRLAMSVPGSGVPAV